VLGLEADERRMWFNIHPNVYRHGLMLEDLAPAQREAAMRLMQATLSARGFAQARDIMRLNGLLVEITGRSEDFGEWPYFVTLFGMPSAGAPWGWQIDAFMRALDARQTSKAVLRGSIMPEDLMFSVRIRSGGSGRERAGVPSGVRGDGGPQSSRLARRPTGVRSGRRLGLSAGRRGRNVARHPAQPALDPLAVLEAGQVARDDRSRGGQAREALAHRRERQAHLFGDLRIEAFAVFSEAMKDIHWMPQPCK
jgi:hypothetical protein